MATKRTTKKAETMAAKKAAKTVAEVKATAAAEVKAEPSKAEAVKTAVVETVKAATETVKAATESVKETAKEAVKETAKAKKPVVRRTAKKAAVAAEEIFIQYAGKEFTTKDVVANVKKAWTEMTGKKEEDIQDIKVYVKTEENKAYYVVNGEAEGHYVEL